MVRRVAGFALATSLLVAGCNNAPKEAAPQAVASARTGGVGADRGSPVQGMAGRAPEGADDPVVEQRKAPVAPAAKQENYPMVLGGGVTQLPVALTDVAKDPKAFTDKTIATKGTVIAVCEHQGCWMEIKDDRGQAHIKMAGHSFFVPRSANGHKAIVQGKIIGGNPDEECKKEAAEQMGKPVAKLELEATGVQID